MDQIEFYDKSNGGLIAFVESSMIVPAGSYISIRGATWQVMHVTFALDYSDDPSQKRICCNVYLQKL